MTSAITVMITSQEIAMKELRDEHTEEVDNLTSTQNDDGLDTDLLNGNL